MSDFNKKIITVKGNELLAQAVAGGKIEFTKLVMGSGKLSGDISSVTDVLSAQKILNITNISRKENQCLINSQLKAGDISSEFQWTELGVFAKGSDGVEVLYTYAYSDKPSFITPSLDEKLIQVGVVVDNAENITAIIDGSLVYLTLESLNKHDTDPESHGDIRESIEAIKGDIANIDVSWEGVTGKPATFPPSSHEHTKANITDFAHRHGWGEIDGTPTSMPANGGNADTVGGKTFHWRFGQGSPSHIWGSSGSASEMEVFAPGQITVGSANNASNANTLKNRDLCAEVDNLKQSVVDGKQTVANAINGKAGSSLSSGSTFGDMAHIINSQLVGKSDDRSLLLKFYANIKQNIYRDGYLEESVKTIFGNDMVHVNNSNMSFPHSQYQYIIACSESKLVIDELKGSYATIVSEYQSYYWRVLELTGDCTVGDNYAGREISFIKRGAMERLLKA